ncbi:MAG: hypothetical protein AB8G05_23415 [Oligoflexales bacterium]
MVRLFLIFAILLMTSICFGKSHALSFSIDEQIIFFDTKDPYFLKSNSKQTLSQLEFRDHLDSYAKEMLNQALEPEFILSILNPIFTLFEYTETVYFVIEKFDLNEFDAIKSCDLDCNDLENFK